MANTLRAQYFVSDVTQFPGVAMAWAARFGVQPHPFICIQTPNAMPAPGAVLMPISGFPPFRKMCRQFIILQHQNGAL
jgi:hypothetical protein